MTFSGQGLLALHISSGLSMTDVIFHITRAHVSSQGCEGQGLTAPKVGVGLATMHLSLSPTSGPGSRGAPEDPNMGKGNCMVIIIMGHWIIASSGLSPRTFLTWVTLPEA